MNELQYILWIIPLIILLIFWLEKRYSYWRDRGVVTPPFRYFFGNIFDILLERENFPEFLSKSYNYFKSRNLPHGGLYSFFSPVYIPIDNDIVCSILKNDWDYFMSRGLYYNEDDDPLSVHLASLDGIKWKRLRRSFTPTFTPAQMRIMLETIVDSADYMENILRKSEGKPIHTKELLNRFSIDVIARCAFGIETDHLRENEEEIYKNVGAFFNRTFLENFKLFLGDYFPKLMKSLHVRVNRPEVSDFIMNLIREVVQYREKNNVYRKDFMHSMIQLKNRGKLVDDRKLFSDDVTNDDEENKITYEEMCAQAFVFFIGGFDSSANTISFCLYLLSIHKDIQRDVRMEIRDIIEKNGGKLDYDALKKMILLDIVLKETLRMYPTVPYIFRICTKEYKIPQKDLVLKKGQKIFIPSFAIHHDADNYPDPEKFDPERFSKENSNNRDPSTYLPFGDGPRTCIAKRFGIMQSKIALISLLRNNEFSLNEKTISPLKWNTKNPMVLSPEGGIWLEHKRID